MKKLDALKCFVVANVLAFVPLTPSVFAAGDPVPSVGKLNGVCAKQEDKSIVVTGSLGVKDSCTKASAKLTGWDKKDPPNMLVNVKPKHSNDTGACAQVVTWAPFSLKSPYQPVDLIKVSSSDDAVGVKLGACSNTQ